MKTRKTSFGCISIWPGFWVLILPFFVFTSCEQYDPPEKSSELVWSDEFNGNALDESKWEYMIGDGSDYGIWRWGNNEEQYYRKENVTVENGVLKIKSFRESIAGYDYTSARIRSLNKGDFKYGRIEAGIRMDNTGGLWHAFWMLPTDQDKGWPAGGEIDIMEYVGNLPNEVIHTIHFADRFGNHSQIGEPSPMPDASVFRQYAVEWDENKITWFVDSVETFAVKRTNSLINNTWPFDAEFHLLLNTAVGGNLGGAVNGTALYSPKYMEVDYVRVYQNQ